jgi:hypothetical protein
MKHASVLRRATFLALISAGMTAKVLVSTVFENDQSLGHFLVNGHDFSPPSVEINLGGQALERWPREC